MRTPCLDLSRRLEKMMEPSFVSSVEAPTMAMDLGSKKHFIPDELGLTSVSPASKRRGKIKYPRRGFPEEIAKGGHIHRSREAG